MLLKALMKPLQERERGERERERERERGRRRGAREREARRIEGKRGKERMKTEQMQVYYIEHLKVTLIFFPYISECP